MPPTICANMIPPHQAGSLRTCRMRTSESRSGGDTRPLYSRHAHKMVTLRSVACYNVSSMILSSRVQAANSNSERCSPFSPVFQNCCLYWAYSLSGGGETLDSSNSASVCRSLQHEKSIFRPRGIRERATDAFFGPLLV